MPVRSTPQAATEKWVNRLSGATQEITAGVQRVQVSPGQLAAQKHQKWLAAVNEAAPKWRRNVGQVSLEQWQRLMTQVGIPRIAQGAQQKRGKFEQFASEFFPHLERGVAQIQRMDDTTFEARINKAVAMMRHNRQFKRGQGAAGGPPAA